jgi:hypothetical protein
MKAEITNNKKQFEPIEVKITIESFDELMTLICKLNQPLKNIYDNKPNELKDVVFNEEGYSIWCTVGKDLFRMAIEQKNNR